MERIGLFGGTFNPVHNGHLALARSARDYLRLDRLIVMPAFIPPHKRLTDDAGAQARLMMTRLAFAGEPDTVVSDYEIKRGDVSYTVDTLRELRTQYPDARLFLLVGTDMLLSFRRWRSWRDILQMAALAVTEREHGEHTAAEKAAAGLRGETGAEIILIPAEPYPVSSTQLREAVRRGEDAASLVPDAVRSYITDHELYRGDDNNADG